MLRAMRKNVKSLKPTLWIVIATFIVAIFAIWGGAGRLGEGGGTGVLASVGKTKISEEAYYQILRDRLEAARKEYSGITRTMIEQMNIPQQVLEQLIQQTLLLQIARDMGIRASDEEVRDKIISFPVFQRDGKFVGFDHYKQILDWNRIPLGEFEENLKKEVILAKLVSVLTAGITVTPDEVWEGYKKDKETARIEYLVIEKDKLEVPETTDARLQSYFEQNKSRFRMPERRVADYVFLGMEELKKGIKIEESEIEEAYKEYRGEFKNPEGYRVSRIFFPFSGQNREAVLSQAGDVLKRIEGGEDFGALARQFSKDEKAKDGGDWGLNDWRALDPKETAEIRNMEQGKNSGVIETGSGASILKVTEKTEASERPLSDVRDILVNILTSRKSRQAAAEKIDRLEKRAQKEKSLDVAAQKEGFAVKSTGPLKKGGPLDGVDNSGAISEALFALKEKEISKSIQTYDGIGIVQLQKIEAPRDATLEDVKADVEKEILDKEKDARALAKLKEVRAQLKPGNWPDIAAKNKLEWKTVEEHKREQYISLVGQNPEVDKLLFSMEPEQVSEPMAVEGGYALFRLLQKKEATAADFEQDKEKERSALLESKKNKFLQSYIAKAREERGTKINYELFTRTNSEVLSRFSGD